MNARHTPSFQADSRPVAPGRASNGAEHLIECLVAQGVDTVFGYPGGAVLPLYDALHQQSDLRHVLVRHEQAAVHAAQGYARATGKPGVVWVTSGPGMANTISGLLDAHSDGTPIVCISGQVATPVIGTDAFQECDALGLSRPVTKWNHQVRDPEEVWRAVEIGFEVCLSGRPGPVLIDFPKDVQLAPMPARFPARMPDIEPLEVSVAPWLQEATRWLLQARRPLFYVGGGFSGCGAIRLPGGVVGSSSFRQPGIISVATPAEMPSAATQKVRIERRRSRATKETSAPALTRPPSPAPRRRPACRRRA